MEMITQIKARSLSIVMDPGTVGALRNIPAALITEWLSQIDILILNEEEALYISKKENLKAALFHLAALTPLVIVKRGENGATAIFDHVRIVEVPAQKVDVIDTTGAGDSFAAGFMSAWYANPDLEMAIKGGITRASVCIAGVGARPPLN